MSPTRRWTVWAGLAGTFLVGLAVGHWTGIGSELVAWLILLGGAGLAVPSVWQTVTAERALALQRAQYGAEQEERSADRQRARADLEALADHAYQRAAVTLRSMPEMPYDSWFDWGNLFGIVAGRELRELFLRVQRAAALAGGDATVVGGQLHATFLELDHTVRLITSNSGEPRSIPDLAAVAVKLRQVLREQLAALGARVDSSARF